MKYSTEESHRHWKLRRRCVLKPGGMRSIYRENKRKFELARHVSLMCWTHKRCGARNYNVYHARQSADTSCCGFPDFGDCQM